MNGQNRIIGIEELIKLSKVQLVDLFILLNRENKSISQLRESVKQMIEASEENKLKLRITKVIKVDGVIYRIHPIYNLYASSLDVKIVNIKREKPMTGCVNKTGYLYFNVRKFGGKSEKVYRVHRFVWESYLGIIPDGLVIYYRNDIKDDNRLSNLQMLTQQQNCQKSAKNHDYSFVKNSYRNRKCPRAVNFTTNEVKMFLKVCVPCIKVWVLIKELLKIFAIKSMAVKQVNRKKMDIRINLYISSK